MTQPTTEHLDPKERWSRRSLFIGCLVAAFVIIGGALSWPWLTGNPATSTNAPRSDQTKGASTLAKHTAPPANAATNPAAPETVGRNERIEATAKENLNLNASQRTAVDDFAARHAQQKMDHVDFTIAVGAAVPQKTALGDIPVTLSNTLSAYSGDKYFIVPNQFVIVEKGTLRIVAIIPVTT
jgi:hypothetical protein